MGRFWAVAVLLLAGCVVSPSGGHLFVPARDPSLSAFAAAREWDPDAILARVHGVEPAEPVAEMPRLADVADPRLGDGRAQAWEYLYSEAGRFFLVIVDADGKIINKGEVNEPNDSQTAIQVSVPLEWNLDTDEVVQIVRRHVPDWDASVRKADVVHWYLVFAGAEDAHWLVGFSESSEGRTYLVNARNGTFVPLDRAQFRGASVPPWEGARQSAVLSPQQSTFGLTFKVEAMHHPLLSVGLRVERATTGTVNLTLKREGKDLAWVDWRANDVPGARKSGVAWPANGTYELEARLTSLTPQPVEVFWCASGLPTGSLRDHACRL